MSLLPDRHPQKDFFFLDISDVIPKDDLASMEHPLFSLKTQPDMRELEYRNGGIRLSILPSGRGLPTIFDKDILIFCISQLMEKKNRGEPIGKRVRFTARELLIATNRTTNNLGYRRLEHAFQRLRGTTFSSNIRTGGKIETRVFGMIDEGSFVRTADERFRLDYCEVVLSDWLFSSIEAGEVATISRDYFRLRRPLERRLYEIARKHCAHQKRWHISLEKLRLKTGSSAPLKKFRLNIRKTIEADNLPFYRLALTDEDLVIFRPRSAQEVLSPEISLPEWAEDKARSIARDRGRDYYALRSQWLEYAKSEVSNGNPARNPGAAFVAYCKRQSSLR